MLIGGGDLIIGWYFAWLQTEAKTTCNKKKKKIQSLQLLKEHSVSDLVNKAVHSVAARIKERSVRIRSLFCRFVSIMAIIPNMLIEFSSPHVADFLRQSDPVMGKLIDRHGPCRIEVSASDAPYDSLASAIIYQQLHGKAAATILQRVKDLVGGERFPLPKELIAFSESELRSAGLSANKQKALRDLATKVLDGSLPTRQDIHTMGDEQIIENCTRVRGIGRWTVQIMLIFRLGRPDVLPADDYGLRNGLRKAYGLDSLPTPKELDTFGVRWSPWRSVAACYLWRATDS